MYQINEVDTKHGKFWDLWICSFREEEDPYWLARFATRKSVLKLIHYLNGGDLSMNHDIKRNVQTEQELDWNQDIDIIDYLHAEEDSLGYVVPK